MGDRVASDGVDLVPTAPLGDVRARVRAHMALVEEGDYFALLGLRPDATANEIEPAFSELQRIFDSAAWPSHSTDLADLADAVREIEAVLEEAFAILRDEGRRERYRRAIGHGA